jgi:hypothetical protein
LLYRPRTAPYNCAMSIITAILEPDADGSIRLLLPPELRGAKVKIEAKLEPVDSTPPTAMTPPKKAKAGLMKDIPGTFWMADDFDAPLEDFKEYME